MLKSGSIVLNPEDTIQTRLDKLFEKLFAKYPEQPEQHTYIREHISGWVDLLVERKSQNTLLAYISHIYFFLDYTLFANTGFTITIAQAENFFKLLEKKAVSKNTVLFASRSFYNYLVRRGIVTNNPFTLIESLGLPSRLPRPLSEEEYTDIYRTINWLRTEASHRFFATDEYLIPFLILMNSGLRIDEMIRLRTTDFIRHDDGKLSIRIMGKGRYERIALFVNIYNAWSPTIFTRPYVKVVVGREDTLSDLIWNYIRVLESEGSSLIFPYSKQMLYNQFKPVKQALISRFGYTLVDLSKFTPHSFRHSYATYLLNNIGLPLYDVMKLLGHRSPKTTLIYARVSVEDIIKRADSLGGEVSY